MYALADCNNFFVSCERVFRPDLWNKPVVVLSGNDGCVVSRSNEVKALGIKMGVPLYQIRKEVELYGITCFSSNFSLYGDMSSRVMSILRKHTTRFEQYSIDESFINVDHIPADEQKHYCEQIVREIYQGTGIPVSMGIAPSKTLAKVASKYAKKYKGYHGVCIIDSDTKRRKALETFEIGDIWGIGGKAKAKLQGAGVLTALQFADRNKEFAHNLLHKTGLMTWRELNGEDCIDIKDFSQKLSITHSRTFATAITELPVLEQQISDFCEACARQLRMQESVCQRLTVYVSTSRFRTDIEQHRIDVETALPIPTANTAELLQYALSTLRKNFRPNTPYKKAGIILTHIFPQNSTLPYLFDERNREKDSRLQATLDMMHDKFGKRTIVFGTQTTPISADSQNQEVYKMENRSPLYTTDISQLLHIRV
ncbi:MAG: Y-family DNA polymerase [Paludibacteraceae bacterium]|nr:Y-family DNA polymerase [Paludibacteraceae bacterium]